MSRYKDVLPDSDLWVRWTLDPKVSKWEKLLAGVIVNAFGREHTVIIEQSIVVNQDTTSLNGEVFREQHCFHPDIVVDDFLCLQVDGTDDRRGGPHGYATVVDEDNEVDALLAEQGYVVLHISCTDVDEHLYPYRKARKTQRGESYSAWRPGKLARIKRLLDNPPTHRTKQLNEAQLRDKENNNNNGT